MPIAIEKCEQLWSHRRSLPSTAQTRMGCHIKGSWEGGQQLSHEVSDVDERVSGLCNQSHFLHQLCAKNTTMQGCWWASAFLAPMWLFAPLIGQTTREPSINVDSVSHRWVASSTSPMCTPLLDNRVDPVREDRRRQWQPARNSLSTTFSESIGKVSHQPSPEGRSVSLNHSKRDTESVYQMPTYLTLLTTCI